MDKNMYTRQEVVKHPWAILPEALTAILTAARDGGEVAAGDVHARPADTRSPRTGTVAILPLVGVIDYRESLFAALFGGTSVQGFTRAFRSVVRDESVKAVILDVDSPGGSVSGIEELSAEVFKARGSKPIIAVSNTLMASAAYWIASAADEVIVTPSSLTGSIGVYAAHLDMSVALEMEGVKVTLVSAGKYKVEGNPYEPLTDEARESLQGTVDDYYGAFVGSVARNRGVTRGAVQSGFGEGRVLTAKAAVDAGLADRVATFDQVLARYGVRGTIAAEELAGEEPPAPPPINPPAPPPTRRAVEDVRRYHRLKTR